MYMVENVFGVVVLFFGDVDVFGLLIGLFIY